MKTPRFTWMCLVTFPALLNASAYFSRATDTIRLPAGTAFGAVTIEARIMLTAADWATIWEEWDNNCENKFLGIQAGSNPYIDGFLNNIGGHPYSFAGRAPVKLYTWHHVAYGYDGYQDRLYLDGALVNSRWSMSNSVINASGVGFIGARWRTSLGASFRGCLDMLRISTIARQHPLRG